MWQSEASFLANLWQTTLRAKVGDTLRLVKLRGFEPLTPCMPLTSQPLAPQHASTRCLISVLLSTQIGRKRHGAGCGDVRLGCWQIAGSSGHKRLSVIARSASRWARAPAVQCCPQKNWIEDTAQGSKASSRAPRRAGPRLDRPAQLGPDRARGEFGSSASLRRQSSR